jgi:hypothetical protein
MDEPSRQSRTSRKRERSARYPGAPLGDAIDLARRIDERGVDGLPASAIAAAVGYSSIKTRTFSARLSAARQFGLVALARGGYSLTILARSLLHPVDPAKSAELRRTAFLAPPLYAEIVAKLAGRRVPDAAALANWLYHEHDITTAAKRAAAETFLASAREAGVLGDDGVLRMNDDANAGGARPQAPPEPADPTSVPIRRGAGRPVSRDPHEVRFALRLWGRDRGKTIRVRAPEAIDRASFERFLQAFRLLVRVEDDAAASTS